MSGQVGLVRRPSTRNSRRSAQRWRAWAAWGALLAWFFGLELLPNLHIWHHNAAEHNHDSAGTMVLVRFGPDVELSPHRHRDGGFHDPMATQSHHQARRNHREDHTTVEAPSRDQNRHIATGLAHRATAIAAAPAMLPLPVRSVLRDVEIALRTSATLYAMDALAPSARGPPANRILSCS